MYKKECIAMVLAGGRGSRLASLTTQIPKPAIPFGGCCRLIDFTLSNCYNSGLDTFGILTMKQPLGHNQPFNSILASGLARDRYNMHTLPPSDMSTLSSYTGTANAIYENIDFIERFNPEYVFVLSGDHVYKMDYRPFLEYHKEKGADVTLAVIKVPWSEAPRLGNIVIRPDGSVAEFTEKPMQPKSNLASMGVYVFSWRKLRHYLLQDAANPFSQHDFGKNIIPAILAQEGKIYAHVFTGYWRDVGTVESLYEAHMDLLANMPPFDIQDADWPLYSTLTDLPLPITVSENRKKSLISKSCVIRGEVEKSIIFPNVYIGNKAKVKNSVIMPGAYVGSDAYVEGAIVGPGAAVENGCAIFGDVARPIAVLGQNTVASSIRTEFARSSSGKIWRVRLGQEA